MRGLGFILRDDGSSLQRQRAKYLSLPSLGLRGWERGLWNAQLFLLGLYPSLRGFLKVTKAVRWGAFIAVEEGKGVMRFVIFVDIIYFPRFSERAWFRFPVSKHH